jgi:hypothetical protein
MTFYFGSYFLHKKIRAFVEELFVDVDVDSALDALDVTLSAGELSLVLQIFHAAGVLVGLAMRSGVAVHIPLPQYAYLVLSNSEDCLSSKRDDIRSRRLLLRTCSLALRTGVLSLYPEAALDLLHVGEMQRLFEGQSLSCSGCVNVAELFRTAEYVGEPVESIHMQVSNIIQFVVFRTDQNHLQHFWAVMYELSFSQIRQFLKKLLASCKDLINDEADRDAMLYGGRAVRLRLVCDGPTVPDAQSDATALSAVNAPGDGEMCCLGLRVPRYSNLKVALRHLLAFIADTTSSVTALGVSSPLETSDKVSSRV